MMCAGVLFFKFVGSEEISRIWKSLMQVWITGHHRFLREVIGLLMVLTRLNRTSVSGNTFPFSELRP